MIDFVKRRYLFFLASALVILPGVISLLLPGGIHPGIDFTSGSILTLRFSRPVETGELREAFEQQPRREEDLDRNAQLRLPAPSELARGPLEARRLVEQRLAAPV